jgi:hypothetical protein
MTQQEIIDLMKSSKSDNEWNDNCAKVKTEFGGHYPDFWYAAIIQSDLVNQTLGPGSDEIKISTL